MSVDLTKNLDDKKPFEERVFVRFDAIEEYLRSLDGRVQVLESRSYDTKPIWERALQEIVETRQELKETRGELNETRAEVKETRAELRETRAELKETRAEVKETRAEGTETRAELKETRAEVKEMFDELKYFKRVVTDRLDQIQSVVLEMRIDGRRAHDRIDKLEAKPS